MDSSIEIEATEKRFCMDMVDVGATVEVLEFNTSIEMLVGVDAGMVVAGENIFVVAVDVTGIDTTGPNTRLVTCVWFTEK